MFHKYRSSRPKVFSKNDVFKGFTKFTRKHLWQSLVLNLHMGSCNGCFSWMFYNSIKEINRLRKEEKIG